MNRSHRAVARMRIMRLLLFFSLFCSDIVVGRAGGRLAGQLQRAGGHDGGWRQGRPQGHLLRVALLRGLHTRRRSHKGDDYLDLEARHRHVYTVVPYIPFSSCLSFS